MAETGLIAPSMLPGVALEFGHVRNVIAYGANRLPVLISRLPRVSLSSEHRESSPSLEKSMQGGELRVLMRR